MIEEKIDEEKEEENHISLRENSNIGCMDSLEALRLEGTSAMQIEPLLDQAKEGREEVVEVRSIQTGEKERIEEAIQGNKCEG